MKAPNVTPGKWKAGDLFYCHGNPKTIIITSTKQIAETTFSEKSTYHVNDLSQAEANARLMAAAPELAEALLPFALLACDTPHVDEPECHNCKARAALIAAGYTEE